jgi:FkbM family methyltransferase
MKIVQKAIKESKSISDKELISILKSTQLPLVLWGAAKLAKFVFGILKDNDITVSSIFVDTQDECRFFNAMKIKTFEEVCSSYERFNILIANSEYQLQKKYLNHEQVENIFTIFDFPSYGFSWDENFLNNNSNILNQLWDILEDKLSKASFEAYVVSRATNNWNRIQPFILGDQYFPEFIKLTEGEVFVDCGAYTGDSLLDFIKRINGRFKKYFALEPSPNNANILEKIIVDNKLSNVQLVRKGAWNKQERFLFEEDTDTSHMLLGKSMNKSIIIETDLIDNIVSLAATFIKMDIEGAELMALKGAANTIIKNKPKLAIAVYHKMDDLITIPSYIKSLRSDYKFYFRLHNKLGTDAVLYAI